MIVYVITQGEYSDYGIVAVTLEKEKAEELKTRYTDKWHEAMIETYDTDDYDVEKGRFYEVKLGTRASIRVREIDPVCVDDKNKVRTMRNFKTKEREYVVIVKAKDEEHAKKIGADLVAKYKAQQQGI